MKATTDMEIEELAIASRNTTVFTYTTLIKMIENTYTSWYPCTKKDGERTQRFSNRFVKRVLK